MRKSFLGLVGILWITFAAGVAALCLRTSIELGDDKRDQVPKAITDIYDIRDLLSSIPNYPLPGDEASPQPESPTSGSQAAEGGLFGGSSNTGKGEQDTAQQDKVQNIIKLLQDCVDQNSWRDNGGSIGTVRTVGNLLVVTQTPDNRQAVQIMLDRLRRQQFCTIEVDADWLLLTNDQINAWQSAAKTSAGKLAVDAESAPAQDVASNAAQSQAALNALLHDFLKDSRTVFARGRVVGMNGQIVSIYGGRSEKIINGAVPVISPNSAGIQAEMERIHSGVALEVRPLLIQNQPEMQFSIPATSPSAPQIADPPAAPTALILDLHSRVREDLSDRKSVAPTTMPTTRPAATLPEDAGNAAATVALAAQALSEPDHQEQQFQATVRLTLGAPMMIDGLTHYPGKTDSRELCLIMTAHIVDAPKTWTRQRPLQSRPLRGRMVIMLPLPRLIFRLTMWMPNLLCRSLRSQVGKPQAWFLPEGWV